MRRRACTEIISRAVKYERLHREKHFPSKPGRALMLDTIVKPVVSYGCELGHLESGAQLPELE